MDADLPAGQRGSGTQPPEPAPTAQEEEQGGGSDTAEDQPSPDTPSEPPEGRGDTPGVAAASAATEGDSPPQSPPQSSPPRKRVRFACPLDTWQEPVLHQPWPGPGMGPQLFSLGAIPPAPPPYTMYTGQPIMGPWPAHYTQHLPKVYLVESVLVTVFCCLVTGAVALIYSYETRAALRRGDMAQAYAASRKAWWLILFSFFFGLFISITWIICILVSLYQ